MAFRRYSHHPFVMIDSAEESTGPAIDTVPWRLAMKRAVRSQRELRRRLGLPIDDLADEAERFPTFVPLELLDRILPDRPDDPILRQVLATREELTHEPGFSADPVGDLNAELAGGLLKKYEGRALIVTHGACAVHCRYCFRKEFPYSTVASRTHHWEPALNSIRLDPSIQEVLLSGGDPLTLTDEVLAGLLDGIEAIPHVDRVRIHTRLPIAIPQRVTDSLLDGLSQSRLSVWMVVHSNHPQEIDDHVASALRQLRRSGVPLLNQSVLLAGVNDSADTLTELSRVLINLGVQPYYLHQLDRVRGASHFHVSVDRGRKILAELRERLPGYAVPRYVVEQEGAKSKTAIA